MAKVVEGLLPVEDRLAELGLSQVGLEQVLGTYQLAYDTRTANDWSLARPLTSYIESIQALRNTFVPNGWKAVEKQRAPFIESADGKILVSIASADEGTGIAAAKPKTRSKKGRVAQEAVNDNRQLDLFTQNNVVPLRPATDDPAATWYLLIYANDEVIRAELSQPNSIGEDNRIDDWIERIIIGEYPRHNKPIDDTRPGDDDFAAEDVIDIVVKKKE